MPLQTRPEEVAESMQVEEGDDKRRALSPGSTDRPKTRAGRPVPMKYAVIVLAVIIVASVIIFVSFSSINQVPPPVDVYSKPAPPEGSDALSILPASILDNPRSDIQYQNATNLNITTCWYDGGIVVEVQNYSSSSFASSCLSASCEMWGESESYDVTSHESGDEYWYAFSGSGISVFSWQKDIWVFFVQAPDDGTRNAAADQLPY